MFPKPCVSPDRYRFAGLVKEVRLQFQRFTPEDSLESRNCIVEPKGNSTTFDVRIPRFDHLHVCHAIITGRSKRPTTNNNNWCSWHVHETLDRSSLHQFIQNGQCEYKRKKNIVQNGTVNENRATVTRFDVYTVLVIFSLGDFQLDCSTFLPYTTLQYASWLFSVSRV